MFFFSFFAKLAPCPIFPGEGSYSLRKLSRLLKQPQFLSPWQFIIVYFLILIYYIIYIIYNIYTVDLML